MSKDNLRLKELEDKKRKGVRLSNSEFKEYKALKRESKESGTSNKFKPGNDFSWWNKYPELMSDAANLKCNWIAGTPLVNHYQAPGVLLVKMLNSYGSEGDATGPINLAARNLYLKMFQKYRGISSYTSADLGITLIATLEVFQLIAKLERIYGVVNYYDMLNRNLPTTVLTAMGINSTDADTIRKNLSNFRYSLNNIILKAQRILFPKDMAILADRVSLYGYLYKDHETSARAQTILFDYDEYGIFSETTLNAGGCVVFAKENKDIEGFDFTFPKLMDFSGNAATPFPLLNLMVEKLLSSESIMKQYGDLLAYFGPDQMVTLLPLPSDYAVTPIYSESILHKLHNSECISQSTGQIANTTLRCIIPAGVNAHDKGKIEDLLDNGVGVLMQFGNIVYTQNTIVNGAAGVYVDNAFYDGRSYANVVSMPFVGNEFIPDGEHVLDAYRADFTPEVVCEGILWKQNIQKKSDDSDRSFHIVESCGVEMVKGYVIYKAGGGTYYPVVNMTDVTQIFEDATCWLSCIDWAPLTFLSSAAGTDRIGGDFDNARALSKTDLFRIQSCAVLSAFRSDIQVHIGSTPNT